MKKNEIALESGIKSQLTENFVRQMRSVFENNYVDLPEKQFDVVRTLEAKSRQANAKLEEATDELVKYKRALIEAKQELAIKESCEDMPATTASKLAEMAKSISAKNMSEFKEKLTIIKEAHFSDKVVRKSTHVDPIKNADYTAVISEEVAQAAKAITILTQR
jgi:hypothetical protein